MIKKLIIPFSYFLIDKCTSCGCSFFKQKTTTSSYILLMFSLISEIVDSLSILFSVYFVSTGITCVIFTGVFHVIITKLISRGSPILIVSNIFWSDITTTVDWNVRALYNVNLNFVNLKTIFNIYISSGLFLRIISLIYMPQ